MLWLALFIALGLGMFAGGWRSLELARRGELPEAHRVLHSAALAAGVSGSLLTIPLLGWPFLSVSVSVPEEITKTVMETVEVPVRVSTWFFWTKTRTELHEVPRSVSETVFHEEKRKRFSLLLLVAMTVVGMSCYFAEKSAVSIIWRIFG